MPRFLYPALVSALLVTALPTLSAQKPAPKEDILAPLDRTVAAAEESLRVGERQIAESRYRSALMQAWMVLGAIHVAEGRLEEARSAFDRASASAVENGAALQSLAVVQLELGDTAPALDTLTRMVSASPRNVQIRRTLAQALIVAGRPLEAVQELEAARAIEPADPEITFALASGYLRAKKLEEAEALFAQVVKARPIPETYVLIGRTYRDFGYYDRARTALQRALKMDPRTRRAHYYLGTTAVMEEGAVRLDEAIAEFRRELKLAPDDAPTTLRLGIALVEARQHEAALPLLEASTRAPSPASDAWLYLGRCQLALGRAADAIASFRRALETADPRTQAAGVVGDVRRRTIHYQLATALRQTGATAEAEREFAEAQRLSVQRAEADREQLADYMADARETAAAAVPAIPLEAGGIDAMPAPQRAELARHATATLARTYLNLGIMHAQAQRFARAAELLEDAAAVDPEFPQLQYSLGIAYFNAQQFEKARAPLARALEKQPQNADVRRMLAIASLNAEDYAKAADLLRDDPRRSSDPSLQYAYGLALVQSDRAEEAEQIFTRVLAEHPEVPELNVVLGQAYAAQDDYEEAVKSFKRALELKRDVAEANAGLGLIYLRQGQLEAAADALRAELAAHPGDLRARYTLATVLDLQNRGDDAIAELRTILAAKPTHATARYLFGKILLARGSAAEALQQLEIAVRLAPDEANIRNQLGQAYQRLGRPELAAREFAVYQQLKDKKRGGE